MRRAGCIAPAAALALWSSAPGCGEYFNPRETPRVDAGARDASRDSAATFHGCTDERFVDRAAPDASRAVAFGEAQAYVPPCLAIAAGQTVTFAGNFTSHPLRPGVNPPLPAAGSPDNPIPSTGAGAQLAVTFRAPGTYPYHCATHYAAGMAGVIRVR